MGVTEMQTNKQTRIWVEIALIRKVQERYPETQGMKYVGVAKWALRKILTKEAV